MSLETTAARVAVIVASRGRPGELGHMVRLLAGQTRAPAQVIFSVTGPDDLPNEIPAGVTVLSGATGLCAQRNLALEHLAADVEVVVMFDDDYVPRSDAIEKLENFFSGHPGIVAANGFLLADGIHGQGISYPEAEGLLRLSNPDDPITIRNASALYGCNMAFRANAIGLLRFDERLPLYGWQEDIDFSSQMSARGKMVSTNALVGVHLGVKRGRVSGLRFGYSQVVNPAYLVKKGTMTPSFAINLALRNMAANILHSLAPEPWVDRRGRLRGNLMGLGSLLLGNADPGKVLEL